MTISKETTLCISIASRPSNFGTTLFNKAFAALDLNYLYKAMRVDPKGDLEGAIRGLRVFGIRGCGVSMPFKERVIPFLDRLDVTAEKTGAVNTIVNGSGVLTGYNTDYLGALEVLKRECDLRGKKVLVYGLGGVAKAIVFALKDLKVDLWVTGRETEKLIRFVEKFPGSALPVTKLSSQEGYLFVNATPVGMAPDEDQMIISEEVIKKFDVILDVVANPLETKLIRVARHLKRKVIPGYMLALEQAWKQFQLYTGKKPPRDVIRVERDFI